MRTSLTASPVKGMLSPMPVASSARALYSVPVLRMLVYTNFAGIDLVMQVWLSLFNTYFIAAVFPVPVFPYIKIFEGLVECSSGARTSAIELSCCERNGRFSGMYSDLKASWFLKRCLDDNAFVKMMSKESFCCVKVGAYLIFNWNTVCMLEWSTPITYQQSKLCLNLT